MRSPTAEEPSYCLWSPGTHGGFGTERGPKQTKARPRPSERCPSEENEFVRTHSASIPIHVIPSPSRGICFSSRRPVQPRCSVIRFGDSPKLTHGADTS